MKNAKKMVVFGSVLTVLFSCAVVRPGQVGLKQTLGKLKPGVIDEGMKMYNPFTSKVIKMNVRTVELYEVLELPTKEGLSVKTEVILLYHVDKDQAKDIYTNYGVNYQKVVVESNFIATAREVSSRYDAKELYAVDRKLVEHVMEDELTKDIGQFGFVIDAVLLKEIMLPPSMEKAIQDKANAEQAVLQMEFEIQKAEKEALRKTIEAEGIRRSQEIIDSSLTESLLKYNYIEMMKALSVSPNAKVVVTNGSVPVMLGDQ